MLCLLTFLAILLTNYYNLVSCYVMVLCLLKTGHSHFLQAACHTSPNSSIVFISGVAGQLCFICTSTPTHFCYGNYQENKRATAETKNLASSQNFCPNFTTHEVNKKRLKLISSQEQYIIFSLFSKNSSALRVVIKKLLVILLPFLPQTLVPCCSVHHFLPPVPYLAEGVQSQYSTFLGSCYARSWLPSAFCKTKNRDCVTLLSSD